MPSRGDEHKVRLRVYDLSNGMLKVFSPIILFKRLEGMWHTGVEVYGYEYFYGGGIVKMRPEEFEHQFSMVPTKVITLGYTTISQSRFEKHLMSIKDNFSHSYYDIAQWNCNNFSDYISKYLVGTGVPSEIVDLPHEINDTFVGRIIISSLKRWNEDLEAKSSMGAEAHPKREMEVMALRHERKHWKMLHDKSKTDCSPTTEKDSYRRTNRDRSEVIVLDSSKQIIKGLQGDIKVANLGLKNRKGRGRVSLLDTSRC